VRLKGPPFALPSLRSHRLPSCTTSDSQMAQPPSSMTAKPSKPDRSCLAALWRWCTSTKASPKDPDFNDSEKSFDYQYASSSESIAKPTHSLDNDNDLHSLAPQESCSRSSEENLRKIQDRTEEIWNRSEASVSRRDAEDSTSSTNASLPRNEVLTICLPVNAKDNKVTPLYG